MKSQVGTLGRFALRLQAAAVLLLLLAAGLTALLTVKAFEAALLPEFDREVESVGRTLGREIERAVDAGLPFRRLYGMQPFLDDLLKANPSLAGIEVGEADGRVRYRAGSPAGGAVVQVPLSTGGRLDLHLVPDFAGRELRGILFDVLIVVAVTLLVAVEALTVLFGQGLVRPVLALDRALARLGQLDFRARLRLADEGELGRVAQAYNGLTSRLGRAGAELREEALDLKAGTLDRGRLHRVDEVVGGLAARVSLPGDGPGEVVAARGGEIVRAPLFVFILAEESARAFLPLYIDGLAAPFLGLSEATVIGLPITVFMLAIALATAPAGRFADRVGVRRTFALGVVPSFVGFVGTAFAGDLTTLILARALCGVGYAMVYIAAQGHMAKGAAPARRAQAMASFMGAVFAAGVCGPAIGGIVVEETGPRVAFLIAAGLVLASALVLFWLVEPDASGPPPPERRRLSAREALRVLAAPRLLLLTAFCAVPAKIALTGFLFYMVPLELARQGNDPGTIGRVMMVYGLCTAFLSPLAAWLADRAKRPAAFVAAGGIIAGLGLAAVGTVPGTPGVLLAVAALGLGHATAIAPQLSLVTGIAAAERERLGETTVLAIFRLAERGGNIVGPLVMAGLVGSLGPTGGIAALGYAVAAAAAAYATAQALTSAFGAAVPREANS